MAMKIPSIAVLILASAAPAVAQIATRPPPPTAQQQMSSETAGPMTMSFSFRGSRGCVSLFENPEIRLKNVPPGATSILVVLSQKDGEMGGQEVLLPRNGILPASSIRTYAPCNAGVYEYGVSVKSAAGLVLAKAQQSRSFPSDEFVK